MHKMCSLKLLREVFEGKLGRRAVVEVLGGVRVTEGGIRSCWKTAVLYYNCL